ncbi:MAG: cyclic nucleotide-binding domain-containing protein, partial [Leptospiraceae bacterium]|nr:cyclic nucleotide-binding domain-containing protein [Leptospiraceae bacterium]
DEVVMRQGEQSTELYIVLEGELGVWQKNAASERRQIDTIQAGGMVGEMAQFDGLPRSADIIAHTPVKALAFSTENFYMLFQLHPRWALQLLTTLAQRLESRRLHLAQEKPV